ncbi:MAG: universal stress protein [Chloroflexota bacterium]|nr:universal stress protein [Chloroflexota bacterium]MDE2968581.1 universal stress protein [Chloroflexota bacterium]
MFRRILTPLDGSTLSEGILPYVRALAPAFGARVALLRTYEDMTHELTFRDNADLTSITTALEPLARRLHNEAEDYLVKVSRGLQELDIATDIAVRSGPTAIHIVNEAETVNGTLVAMSTHGRTGIGRWIMGSVTDRVLHTTTAPLLVVHPERGAPSVDSTAVIQTLIVPLDGSELAETVLPVAAEVAKATGAKILLMESVGVPSGYYPEEDTSGITGVSIVSDMEDQAEEYLGIKARELRDQGAANVDTVVSRGSAAAEIEELARATPDSMIIACTHGRSGVGRAVLGSVIDRLARHSGHPALIVRAPQ